MNTPSESGARDDHRSIALCVPEIGGREWEYVRECLDTGWVSSVGGFVQRFERAVAQRLGCRHAIATSSGTAALHVALLAAGVETDDEVLVSDLTFIAPVNTIRYVGAWPVFIDAEPDYWQMDVGQVQAFLSHECRSSGGWLLNRSTGRRVKAILPVHILGHPVDLDPLCELARRHNLVLIEDATESLGALYRGRPAGHLGDLACLSFNGNKIITTGGGGMLLTDSETWAARARYLTTQAKTDPVEFVHGDVGYNYRLSNVLAAMGCAQMENLDRYVEAKRRIARLYIEGFKDIPGLHPMRQAPWAASIWWMFTLQIEAPAFGMSRQALMRYLAEHRVQTRPLWQPMHRSPAHQDVPSRPCPCAAHLQENCLSLPCSAGLAPGDQEKVIQLIRKAATR